MKMYGNPRPVVVPKQETLESHSVSRILTLLFKLNGTKTFHTSSWYTTSCISHLIMLLGLVIDTIHTNINQFKQYYKNYMLCFNSFTGTKQLKLGKLMSLIIFTWR